VGPAGTGRLPGCLDCLIIRLIIQTIRWAPSRSDGIDGQEHEEPGQGEPDLEWQDDQRMAKQHALLPTSQPSRNGCLVRIGKALPGPDRVAHPGPSGLVEAIVEDEPPFWVVSLPDSVVHW
jgi:hypothetical protein